MSRVNATSFQAFDNCTELSIHRIRSYSSCSSSHLLTHARYLWLIKSKHHEIPKDKQGYANCDFINDAPHNSATLSNIETYQHWLQAKYAHQLVTQQQPQSYNYRYRSYRRSQVTMASNSTSITVLSIHSPSMRWSSLSWATSYCHVIQFQDCTWSVQHKHLYNTHHVRHRFSIINQLIQVIS